MITPPTPEIRSYTLPELLDQTIRLYRNNFFKFIGILALPYIPLVALQTVMAYLMASSTVGAIESSLYSSPDDVFGPTFLIGAIGTVAGLIFNLFLIQGVATAALTRAIADYYAGKPIGIMKSYDRIGSSWIRLILAILAIVLLFLLLFVWMNVPIVGWFTGPGILLFMGMAILPLIAPVVVLERHGAFGSLRRAWDLARSRFWWVLGFVFVLNLLSQIVVSGPAMIVNFILQVVLVSGEASFDQMSILASVVPALITMVFNLLYLPLQLIAMTLVYFDLRVRMEGLDLAMLSSPPPVDDEDKDSAFFPELVAPRQPSLVTGTEVGYFAILSLIGGTVYCCLVGFFLLPMLVLLGAA